MFQSLGWKNKVYGHVLDSGSRLIAWLIFIGYVSIPISVLVFHYGKEVAK